MTAIPRGSDTRQAVRALTKAVDNLFREIQQLRIEQYGLRGELRKLACQTVPPETALSGPYWEARAKALYDREPACLEPTYPERLRSIEDKLSGRVHPKDWQDTGPREG